MALNILELSEKLKGRQDLRDKDAAPNRQYKTLSLPHVMKTAAALVLCLCGAAAASDDEQARARLLCLVLRPT